LQRVNVAIIPPPAVPGAPQPTAAPGLAALPLPVPCAPHPPRALPAVPAVGCHNATCMCFLHGGLFRALNLMIRNASSCMHASSQALHGHHPPLTVFLSFHCTPIALSQQRKRRPCCCVASTSPLAGPARTLCRHPSSARRPSANGPQKCCVVYAALMALRAFVYAWRLLTLLVVRRLLSAILWLPIAFLGSSDILALPQRGGVTALCSP